MSIQFETLRDALDHGFDTVIDVRSPAEFAEDHLPRAISLPVLDDDERAQVGTIYKQQSAFRARKIGAALVARNAARHIDGPLAAHDGSWRPLVYCWRGGQRSGSFASILKEIGWRVETVAGGYKSWRRLVVDALYEAPFPARLILLDGNTGTAKTALLGRLAKLGIQTIDLEGLARHRGSLLGGQGLQPHQKAFETRLAHEVATLDTARPVLVEAESTRIGRLNLPPSLVEAMQNAPRIEITAPLSARATYLVGAYSDVLECPSELAGRVLRLAHLVGTSRSQRWASMVLSGEHEAVATELIASHYDPAYEKSRARYGTDPIAVLESPELEPGSLDVLARRIAGLVTPR